MIPNENAYNLFQENQPGGSEFGSSKSVNWKAYFFPLRQDSRLEI
jgi:hypothetical protein